MNQDEFFTNLGALTAKFGIVKYQLRGETKDAKTVSVISDGNSQAITRLERHLGMLEDLEMRNFALTLANEALEPSKQLIAENKKLKSLLREIRDIADSLQSRLDR